MRDLLKASTIAESMKSAGGIGPGFDFLRIFLALAILFWHSVFITHGRDYFDWTNSAIYPLILMLVPAFFALSGFLVTGSALRLRSVKTFLVFRSLRIFPALIVEVSLCAVILGAIVTTLPLGQYFSNIKFWAYFGNIVGFIRFELPGVFEENPLPRTVNGSLWTLRPEFYCYLLMATLMATRIVYERKTYTLIFGLTTIALLIADAVMKIGSPKPLAPEEVVVYCFFVGIAFFHWRDVIPVGPAHGLAAFATAYYMIGKPGLGYLAIFPVCYAVLCIGMISIQLPKLFSKGDYSYGI